MSYFRWRAERAAYKGGRGLLLVIAQVCVVLLVLFWPLGIGMSSSGTPSASGWLFEGCYLLAAAGVVITFRGRRRKRP